MNKAQKQRATVAKQTYGTLMDMGRMLRLARLASGLKVSYIAKYMGVLSDDDWLAYEHNRQPIPGHIIIKLMIFGTEFWRRNQERFEQIIDNPPVGDDSPLPDEGEPATNN